LWATPPASWRSCGGTSFSAYRFSLFVTLQRLRRRPIRGALTEESNSLASCLSGRMSEPWVMPV